MVPDRLTRRRVLGSLGTAGALSIAGCIGGDGGDGVDPSDTETTDRSPSPTTTTAQPNVRLQATITGLVAEYEPGNTDTTADGSLRQTVASGLENVSVEDVAVDQEAGVVEVRAAAEPTALVDVLAEAGVEITNADVRRGVRAETREAVLAVVRDRLETAGYGDATVSVESTEGHKTVVVAVTADSEVEIRDLLDDRGRVRLVASAPASSASEDERRTVTLATQGDFARIGDVQQPSGTRPPAVPVTLTDEAAQELTDQLVDLGFTDDGVQSCRWQDNKDEPGYCIYTMVDGEVTYAASLSVGLAQLFRTGEFVEHPEFVMQTVDHETAEALRRNLVAGALPAPLAFEATE